MWHEAGQEKFIYDTVTGRSAYDNGDLLHHIDLIEQVAPDLDEAWVDYYAASSSQDRFVFGQQGEILPGNYSTETLKAAETAYSGWLDKEGSVCYNILDAQNAPVNDPWRETLPKKANMPLTEPEDFGNGWTVREMESGEYPDHDAIHIDRDKKQIVLNYQGHHMPMYEALPELANSHSYTTGHFRLSPSTTEPFPAGWGWHGNEATDEEKAIILQVLKRRYQVDKMKALYKPVEEDEAEEPYWDLDEPEHEAAVKTKKWPPPPKKTDPPKKATAWKAVYNPVSKHVALLTSKDIHPYDIMKNDTSGRSIIAEGFYHKINGIWTFNPELKREARYHIEQELLKTWPTIAKETHFKKVAYIRWMYSQDGDVVMGEYDTHFDLLCDNSYYDAADQYANHNLSPSEYYPFVTGGYLDDDGEIDIVRSIGEPDFNPKEVARAVALQAREEGYYVSGEVNFRDDSQGHSESPSTRFRIE